MRRVAWVALCAMVAACAPPEAPAAPDPEVLMEADRAFSAEVQEGGAEAWASWFAEDGRMVPPRVGLIEGREAIRAAMAVLDQPGVVLSWEPDYADISASGDMGWTTGTYASEGPGPDGSTVRGSGRYVSIWRLQADGTWRVVMDLGEPDPAPAG